MERKVVLGDDAKCPERTRKPGIWNVAKEHFPGAIQIVDLYHARQHLWDVARLLYPTDVKRRNAWIGLHQKRWLDKGKILKLVAALRSIHTSDTDLAKKIRNEADYFATNAARMNYIPSSASSTCSSAPAISRPDATSASASSNPACGTHASVFWTVNGANSILARRCQHLNGRFEDYWEARRAA